MLTTQLVDKKIFLILFALLISCSSKKEVVKEELPPPPPVIQQPVMNPRAAIKENSTFVGAVVVTVDLIDSINYKFKVNLQTAIADHSMPTLLEPGQSVEVFPAFILDENNDVDMNNPINKKLLELRILKKKGYFIGKLTVAPDNKCYITEVDVFQNPPEGVNNED
ncbi:MAG: hypothetical protein Q8K98_05400 [Bacteroidota bacterium]|nr:hypothetical protein [Bacteroidota bacterium]